MNDVISIEGLELWTHIGVSDEERRTEQRIVVSITIPTDTTQAAQFDDVSMSTNYEEICDAVRSITGTRYKTIEALAENIAQMILQSFKLENVTVSVRKFILPGVDAVGVTITRP